MRSRIAVLILAVACTARTAPAPAPVQHTVPDRAIRRDIPLTDKILHGLVTGTRDSSGRPGRNYWQQQVDYVINAKLDPATSVISGRETITLHNNAPVPLSSIVFRLDQNYFAPNAARIGPIPRGMEITNGMNVTRMTVNGQSVNLAPPPRRRGVNPAANGPVVFNLDQSVADVALQNLIAPHGSASIDIEWSFKVPGIAPGVRGQRMGRWGDTLYQVAQWYPRVAVFDDLRGWETDQYLGDAEFYNNFGSFDVNIDVPAGWLVGATGTLRNADAVFNATTRERLSHVLESNDTRTIVGPGENGTSPGTGGRNVYHFTADTVNDFAWATAKNYVWQGTRATIPGKGAIPVNVFFLPGDSANFNSAPQWARHALEFYSNLWMPYSFPQLTLADGSELGMEYPMFIMSAQGASDHETGHEWWPMTVSNNETWYGWMDEGFNQYMNILSIADRNGEKPVLDGRGQSYGQTSGDEAESPMMWDANYQSEYYGFTTYSKTPMMLSSLGGIVGDSAVQRAHAEWAKAWRFKHPSPWDYMFFMERALGKDLGWFWYYWLFTTESSDGSIQNVSQAGDQTTVVVRQDGAMPAPIVLKVELAPDPSAAAPANVKMLDPNTALVTLPVDVWFDGRRTYNATLNFGARKITKVTLDPYGRFPDKNPRDNVWPR